MVDDVMGAEISGFTFPPAFGSSCFVPKVVSNTYLRLLPICGLLLRAPCSVLMYLDYCLMLYSVSSMHNAYYCISSLWRSMGIYPRS